MRQAIDQIDTDRLEAGVARRANGIGGHLVRRLNAVDRLLYAWVEMLHTEAGD
ncbi:hypothetical protein OKW49_008251 [Paraburkholderia youngii]